MSGATSSDDAMRLRGEKQPVIRLSRRVLVLLGLAAGSVLGAALIYALGNRPGADAPAELFSTDVRTTADGLAALPRDYGAVPQLGPPLPGDFGRAVLGQQGRPDLPPAVDPGEQQRRQDAAAADASKLFVGTTVRPSPPPTVPGPTPGTPAVTANRDVATDRHQAFLEAPADRRTTAPDRVSPPASGAILQAGSVIAAALLTGIRSDLPGQVTAQVTENVYDSPTGNHLLIPQGSRLLGQYQGGADTGQSRALLVWTRLIRPDGSSIVLERLPGADTAGYAGLEDSVDDHWDKVARAAALSTLLSIGSELASDSSDALLSALRNGAQDTADDAGQRIVSRELSVPPTVTVRPGFPVRVVVTRDLVIAPYGEIP